MTDDPRLAELGKFTPEGKLTPGYGDGYTFFVGRDDVHGILAHLLAAETMVIKVSMFGFDDDALNAILVKKLADPNVRVQLTLDKSQAGGVHEAKILAENAKLGPAWFNSVAIGTSATHQIVHTKGGVLVGSGVWFEGSTNWSDSGEGSGIKFDGKQPAGWKAQENTLHVSTNLVNGSRFGARLDASHMVALQQQQAKAAKDAAA